MYKVKLDAEVEKKPIDAQGMNALKEQPGANHLQFIEISNDEAVADTSEVPSETAPAVEGNQQNGNNGQ